ncbi:MAG: hypothetical protein GC181_12370 [Bacteroidetes bacterium]|nr:hypothetical protein [Bacteroidota bacterium]
MNKTLFYSLICEGLILFNSSCTQEIGQISANTENDLRYLPYGEGVAMNWGFNVGNENVIAFINGDRFMQIGGIHAEADWVSDEITGVIGGCKSGSDFVLISVDYQRGVPELFITRTDSKGSITYQSNDWRLIAEYDGYNEHLLGIEPDGAGGYWILALEEQSLGNDYRYLLHYNSADVQDAKMLISGFYMYMTSDQQGNLFLTRLISTLGEYPMRLQVNATTQDELLAKKVLIPKWSYVFTSNETDWKFLYYQPFEIKYSHNGIYIVKQHNTGIDDQCTGIDVLELNASTGAELHSFTFDLDFPVNNSYNQAKFHSLFEPDNITIALNYSQKSKLIRFTHTGEVVDEIYLSSNSGKTTTNILGYSENRICLMGASTLGNSVNFIPFVYLKDR